MSKFYLSGKNQTRTVTPSNIQQTITPQEGFNALDAVVVNPIKAAMPQTLEQFIMRDDNRDPFSLNLDGAVPAYACYQQTKLVAVYGTPTSIRNSAFEDCTFLETVDGDSVTDLYSKAFCGCKSLRKANFKNAVYIEREVFRNCIFLESADLRNCNELSNFYIIWDCPAFNALDLRNVTNISSQPLGSNLPLELLDISNTHSAVLNASLPNNANLTILVANDTDKAYYQSATNWSAHASKIKTVAEYEQQIGMSYDDYYEIIFGHPRFDTEEAAS